MTPQSNSEQPYEKIKTIIITFFSEHSFPQFTSHSLMIKPKGEESLGIWDTEKLVATIQIVDEGKVRIICLFHYYPIFDNLAQTLFRNGISPDVAIPTNGKLK